MLWPPCMQQRAATGRQASIGSSMGFLAFSSAAYGSSGGVDAVLLAHSAPLRTLCFRRMPMSAAS